MNKLNKIKGCTVFAALAASLLLTLACGDEDPTGLPSHGTEVGADQFFSADRNRSGNFRTTSCRHPNGVWNILDYPI